MVRGNPAGQQHIDIVPTVLGILGVDGMDARGRNILEASFPAQRIYSRMWEFSSIIDGRFSLIRNDKLGTSSLFDMADDPGQTADLSNEPGSMGIRDRLLAEVEALSREDLLSVKESERKLDLEEKEMLRSLGYVE